MAYASAEASLSFDKPESVKAFLDAGALDHKMLGKLEDYVAYQVRTACHTLAFMLWLAVLIVLFAGIVVWCWCDR